MYYGWEIKTDMAATKETPSLSEATLYKISLEYGLKIYRVNSFRSVWRLKTNDGFKYLKRSKLNPHDLLFIYKILEYLTSQAFNHVPRLALNRTGHPYILDQTGIYILTDWYFSKELDFEILMDLKQAANFLARFHLKSRGFTPGPDHINRTCWLNWPAKLEFRLQQLQNFRRLALAEKETSAFSRLFLRHFEPYYREALASYDMLLNSPYPEVATIESRRKSFCHHDYSGRNLLRTYENRLILVDFDYCLSDLRIHDLINLLARNLKHTGWNSWVAGFILREYHQTSPLAREEMEVMHVLLCWPQEFWQVGLQYYVERLPWPKERFLKKLESKINARFARSQFLKEFPEKNGVCRFTAPLCLLP
jgi:CotS family spore coat protein